MREWLVLCGHREDDGLTYGHPTTWRPVTVQAEDEAAARLAAIDKVYDEVPWASHVRPLTVTEVRRGV